MELTADWVVGFVDGKGRFSVGFRPHPSQKTGYQVLPEFRVVQHARDVQVLYALKRFFRCGVVRRTDAERWELRVRKLECLRRVVEFFETHPLRTKKQVDFKKFARIVRWMTEGRHLNPEGLAEIVELASTMSRADRVQARQILAELRRASG